MRGGQCLGQSGSPAAYDVPDQLDSVHPGHVEIGIYSWRELPIIDPAGGSDGV
jgi:hypothetical protein